MNVGDLQPRHSVLGLEPAFVCKVFALNRIADNAAQVIYRTHAGAIRERLVGDADCDPMAVATIERPSALDGDAASLQLACEAKQIELAFPFDPRLTVRLSNVMLL
jgi:hypothetical protein